MLKLGIRVFISICGVYAVWAEVEGRRHKGMLYIGDRPTLHNGSDISLEVNLLDFEGDLYGKRISVELVAYVRPDVRFGSLDELRAQLEKDREAVTRRL